MSYPSQEAALQRAAQLARKHEASMFVVYDGEDEGYAVASEEDLDTFYLMDGALMRIPQYLEDAGRLAMLKQTELNSLDRIGIGESDHPPALDATVTCP